MLLSAESGDILVRRRNYYDRYLASRLANPLEDAKQLVLFRNIPLSDAESLGEAMHAVRGSCGKRGLARVDSAVNCGK
ncbi:hypothetical protein AB0I72_08995 [Nocardiopsis sp. NPDC049922]|uniref:hypothetical protein n=1 Tax=Nocardiopsis sp. NPDC049922 TaxID=3155157 RepID=UPI0033FA2417